MKIFLGVDPGASGAIAVLDEDGVLLEIFDMPVVELKIGKAIKRRVSPELLAHVVSPYAGSVACLEKVSAMPNQGVSSMFAFGESYGIVRGVLATLQISTTLVTPAAWKGAMGLNAGKDGSRVKAMQLWPDRVAYFKRVKDDGRAEACLIAEFGRLKNLW